MRWLKKEEEHSWQYSSKQRALTTAKIKTIETGRAHQVFFTHTWRSLEECLCWSICLRMGWKGGNLVTM